MKVIGAGLPRTATTTQMFALEHLDCGPCYHMRDLLMDLETGLPLWEAVADGKPDWPAVFGEACSTVDWPSAFFYRDLMEAYPEAKVLLSVRDGGEWARSMEKTIWGMWHGDSVLHYLTKARTVVDPLWDRYIKLMGRLNFDEGGAFHGATDQVGLIAAMDRWNSAVISQVPADRLLVWNPSEGLEPLCEFLEIEFPADELPHLNDSRSFQEGMIGGSLDALNEWWDARERPSEGLHGAALSSER
ncbi:MAG: sulfotransferase family protein [Solirubrobacteraceae bacterium]